MYITMNTVLSTENFISKHISNKEPVKSVLLRERKKIKEFKEEKKNNSESEQVD